MPMENTKMVDDKFLMSEKGNEVRDSYTVFCMVATESNLLDSSEQRC